LLPKAAHVLQWIEQKVLLADEEPITQQNNTTRSKNGESSRRGHPGGKP